MFGMCWASYWLRLATVSNFSGARSVPTGWGDSLTKRVANSLEPVMIEDSAAPCSTESVPNVTPGSPATDASATLLDVSGQPITSLDSAKPSEPLSTETPVPASTSESAELSTIIPTSSAGSESPNILAGVPVADTAPADSTASIAGADLPNVLPASTSGTPIESTVSVDCGQKSEDIKRLALKGLKHAAICQRLGISRTTVWRTLKAV